MMKKYNLSSCMKTFCEKRRVELELPPAHENVLRKDQTNLSPSSQKRFLKESNNLKPPPAHENFPPSIVLTSGTVGICARDDRPGESGVLKLSNMAVFSPVRGRRGSAVGG